MSNTKDSYIFPLLRIPKTCYISYSGGVDSSVLLHFCRMKNVNIKALVHFDHGASNSEKAKEFSSKVAASYGIPFNLVRLPTKPKYSDQSLEEYWSICRREYLESLRYYSLLGHHLNDVAETFIHSSVKSYQPRYIKPISGSRLRPLLITPKSNIYAYANQHKLIWVEDESNSDPSFCDRNLIRNSILPNMLELNPGLLKGLRKYYLTQKEKGEFNVPELQL